MKRKVIDPNEIEQNIHEGWGQMTTWTIPFNLKHNGNTPHEQGGPFHNYICKLIDKYAR